MVPAFLDMRALRESMALPCSAPPEGYAGLVAPAPTSGPTRPTPGVPFVSRRKEPKACQGRCPWTPLGGYYHPPSGGKRRSPPERGASSDGTQAINRLPRHGLTAGSVPLIEPKEKIRPICPLSLKWQIGLFLWHKPYRGGCGHRRGSEASPLGEYPEGVSPSGRFFGDFLIGEKVTRGGGAERPPLGGCGGKRPPLGECRGAKPRVRRECRGGPAPSQKSPRSPGSYKFPEDSVSIKENNSSTSSRFKSRR